MDEFEDFRSWKPDKATHRIMMIIDHLTQKGVMDAGLLYEQPFTGIHYEGLDGIFPDASADEIVSILDQINANAEVKEAV